MGGQEIKTTLGRNIKLLRAQRRFSQALLAEKADISIACLSKIERGIKYPKPDILSQIAEGLGIEVYELFISEFKLKPVFVAQLQPLH
jgi:transcriptional regulator with XRE-family HTH domain